MVTYCRILALSISEIKSKTRMEKDKRREKVIVVGAGPVGSLAALYAASRGNDVEIYELRGGMLEYD